MEAFLQKYARDVIGVLSGFDRLVLRGTIRQLAYVQGMMSYLSVCGILLKDFEAHAQQMTQQLKDSMFAVIERAGRPVQHVASSTERKEDLARAIARRDGIEQGPIALLTAVEPCQSFQIYRNRISQRLELRSLQRKCLFLYHYLIHPLFGFMHVRIQSWFPFSVQVCLNGREWLSRQMDRRALSYARRENCFVWLEDADKTQRLMDQQLRVNWPLELDRLVRRVQPAHAKMFGPFRAPHYWSIYQSEWASDVMFRDESALAELYPRFVQHGICCFASPDVMRFLGQRVPAHGRVDGRFAGELMSDLKHRPEGVRIKHRLNGNSIKLYDKQGSVLRVETTLNRPRALKVYRPKEGDETRRCDWRPLRQGVADLHRRAQLSQSANERYAQALATIEVSTPLGEHLRRLAQRTELHGQPLRALRPWDRQDFELLQAVNRGEFLIQGVRNRDLRALLCEPPRSHAERKRQSACISRKLRLLRAHGLLQKISGSHRYQLTAQGRRIITALLTAHAASTQELTKLAA